MNKWTEREFWAALVPAVIGLLTVVGVIGEGDSALVSAITGVVLIVGPAMAYIVMRVWQKIEATRADATIKIEKARSDARIAEAQGDKPS
jgi:hypothetical protein